MRIELKPNLGFAEKIFPEVNKLIIEAGTFLIRDSDYKEMIKEAKMILCKEIDFNYNDFLCNRITKRLRYKTFTKIENTLATITGKDMSQYHNPEFWLSDGNSAFILSVPEPKIIDNFTKAELTEIVTKIWKRSFLEKEDIKYSIEKYGYHLIHYYKKLLEINFSINSSKIIDKYDRCYQRSINQNINDIVEEIWEAR